MESGQRIPCICKSKFSCEFENVGMSRSGKEWKWRRTHGERTQMNINQCKQRQLGCCCGCVLTNYNIYINRVRNLDFTFFPFQFWSECDRLPFKGKMLNKLLHWLSSTSTFVSSIILCQLFITLIMMSEWHIHFLLKFTFLISFALVCFHFLVEFLFFFFIFVVLKIFIWLCFKREKKLFWYFFCFRHKFM